jgi:SPP1 gp7 family putative phage head morphogenesis protein
LDSVPDIYAQAEAFRAAVVSRDEAASLQLARAYAGILKRLQDALDEVLADIARARAEGETVNPAWLWRQRRFKALIAQAEGQLGKYALALEPFLEERRVTNLKRGTRDAASLLNTASVDATFDRLPAAAIENLIGVLREEAPLGALLRRDFTAAGVAHIEGKLIEALAKGWGPNKAALEMRKVVLFPIARAKRIARTEQLRAYRLASLQTYQEHSDIVRGWRWLASKSTRTCLACLLMDGTLHPLDEPMASHVNCRCTAVPALLTTPPPRETGAQWFERQSNETKAQMMRSHAAFDAYQRGALDWRDFLGVKDDPQWGRSVYQRPAVELGFGRVTMALPAR